MIKYLIITLVVLLLLILYVNQNKKELFVPLIFLMIALTTIIVLVFLGY